MIFRQLFEPDSSAYTYLLACQETGVAALIDPVIDTLERDLELIQQLQLKLAYTIDTHLHADHLTGARILRDKTGRQVSSVGQEKARNPRPGMDKSEAEFITIMQDLKLPYPRKIDFAVPGNEQCGKCPANVAHEFQGPCHRFDQGE